MDAARFPLLETPRLSLRAPAQRDIPAWFARAADAESAMLAGDAIARDISAGTAWLERARRRFAAGEAIPWSIERKGGAETVGSITLTLDPAARTAALGFVLGRAYWNCGLATEAAQAVLGYAFEILGLEAVTAEAASRNSASLRVLRKLGFRRLGDFVDPTDGEPCARLRLDARR
ncbi:GNAT family N-acetyltransferase [Escherichia coli]|nr:GNAT family N-acetyltransferase [Escherichia coli]